jgi:diguanylate cyclase (GGDEF)-like protein
MILVSWSSSMPRANELDPRSNSVPWNSSTTRQVLEGTLTAGVPEEYSSSHSRVSCCADFSREQHEIGRMRAEIDRLYREVSDSRNALLTSNEHGDLLQEHLYRLSTSLNAEIRERQATEEKLQRLLLAITREKGDLEILVQILIEQGDAFAEEGEKARMDGLTQIPNRRRLDEYLLKQWCRHGRLQQPVSLLLCDVDHFKLYNDRYGHQRGDDCLKAVANAIKHCLRTDDLVARYGGEEFAMVLPHTPRERALQIAEQVRSTLGAVAIPHVASPVCGLVTLSIGVASRIPPSDAPESRVLVEEADKNLYLAKHRGRNRVTH